MKYFVIIIVLLFSVNVNAQTDTVSNRQNAINVYFGNVSNTLYIKENIKFVNYVRDMKNAEVHILQTTQRSGNGGTEYMYFFTGSNEFIGRNDTLKFNTTADNTNDEIRKKQVAILKLGLMQYVAHSVLATDISIDYVDVSSSNTIVEDKWKSWVFSYDFSVYTNGESSYRSVNLWSFFDIDRITEEWKIQIHFDKSYQKSFFFLESGTITSKTNMNDVSILVAKSLGTHWAVGFRSSTGNNSYNNKKLYSSFSPAIEYNVFQYSKSNIVQFRFQYLVGQNYFVYVDTTIYDKTEELLFNQTLAAAFMINKKWGYINSSVSGRTFLHDFSKNRLNFSSSFNVRLFKGFSVNLRGSYSLIHDQIFLPKSGMSTEEILLRQQQNSTSFSYWGMFGFSYTFGSIYNNVINPRFNYIY